MKLKKQMPIYLPGYIYTDINKYRNWFPFRRQRFPFPTIRRDTIRVDPFPSYTVIISQRRMLEKKKEEEDTTIEE